MDARQAAEEVSRLAIIDADWNARLTAVEDERFAKAVLDALLAPRRVTCEPCKGTGWVPWATYNAVGEAPCEVCDSAGTVPAEPLAVLSADLPKYEQVEGLVYDPESHIPNQPVHWPGLSCTAHDGYPACVPVFVRVPAPYGGDAAMTAQEDK
jgi:hypothetical protein